MGLNLKSTDRCYITINGIQKEDLFLQRLINEVVRIVYNGLEINTISIYIKHF